ncbi:ComEA family DNA-binding protein [Luteimonas sp. e5]
MLGPPGQATAAEAVDINTADAERLHEALQGIDPAHARAIIDYRQAHGAFTSVEQLALVKGVGMQAVARNRERLTVGEARPRQPFSREQKGRVPLTRKP